MRTVRHMYAFSLTVRLLENRLVMIRDVGATLAYTRKDALCRSSLKAG